VRRRRAETGTALVLTLFAIAALAMAVATALLGGSADIRSAGNYRGATQVHFVAESAVAEALQATNAAGVLSFTTDVVQAWGSVWGEPQRDFAPLGGFSYSVTPVAAADDPVNAGRFIAVASGPDGLQNVAVAPVVRATLPTSPGAILLAADVGAVTFAGAAFSIDGRDRTKYGTPGPRVPIRGIATAGDGLAQSIIAGLDDAQRGRILGTGFVGGPPTVPSVSASPLMIGPVLLDRIIETILARPVVKNAAAQLDGDAALGSGSAPVITHLTNPGGVEIEAEGLAGAGILVVDGALTIEGGFTFDGLVLARDSVTLAAESHSGGGSGGGSPHSAAARKDGADEAAGDDKEKGGKEKGGKEKKDKDKDKEKDDKGKHDKDREKDADDDGGKGEKGGHGGSPGKAAIIIRGALWMRSAKLLVSGAVEVVYSTEGLSTAAATLGGAALPAPLEVTALIDCALVPPATGGCP
jgi:hypothetical protein